MVQVVQFLQKNGDKEMIFDAIEEAPQDPIFGLVDLFKNDPREKKVNLLAGVYQDEQLRAELFLSAKRAKERIFSKDLIANYLPIDGLVEFVRNLGDLLFGEKVWQGHSDRIYGAQTTGGTGALRIAAEFIRDYVGKTVCVPNYTWANHHLIFERAGLKVEKYPYYSASLRSFDMDSMVAFLKDLPKKSVVLLHACCHNPTGCDPTMDQWREISRIMKDKELIPFFDCAYQGLGSGLEQDTTALRRFALEGHNMFVAYSCSKNFSMYGQRVGALFVVGENPSIKQRVGSQVKRIIRGNYSNPPAHGARIVLEILSNDELKKQWIQDLQGVRHRMTLMREALIQRLLSRSRQGDFEYLKQHQGMFSFVDLNPTEVRLLVEKFGIYLTGTGRMNITGLTTKNIDYVVNSIISVQERAANSL